MGQIFHRWGGCKDGACLSLFTISLGHILGIHPYSSFVFISYHDHHLYHRALLLCNPPLEPVLSRSSPLSLSCSPSHSVKLMPTARAYKMHLPMSRLFIFIYCLLSLSVPPACLHNVSYAPSVCTSSSCSSGRVMHFDISNPVSF